MSTFGGSRNQISIRNFGTTVTVANSPTARLMYYLSCVSTVLDLSSDSTIRQLSNYSQYYSLDNQEKRLLLILCLTFEPGLLLNKVFFRVDDLGDSGNEFFEIGSTQLNFAVSEDIFIGGVNRRVNNVMFFTSNWIQRNFYNPINSLEAELRPASRGTSLFLFKLNIPLKIFLNYRSDSVKFDRLFICLRISLNCTRFFGHDSPSRT